MEIGRQIRELHERLAARPEFVAKPAHGSGGDGILVIDGRAGRYYREATAGCSAKPRSSITFPMS